MLERADQSDRFRGYREDGLKQTAKKVPGGKSKSNARIATRVL
jgi:hypothetical protein